MQFKVKNDDAFQSKRWNEILGKMILEVEETGKNKGFDSKIFEVIHQEFINHQ